MITKKVLLVSAAALVVGGSAIFASQAVQAQGNQPFSGLVQAIASHFNLPENEVQSVVSQYRESQINNREQKLAEIEKKHLDNLVSQGKITPSQESAINTELTTVKNQLAGENLKSMSPADRRTALKNAASEIKSWAQTQGIDPKLLLPGIGLGRRIGMMWR